MTSAAQDSASGLAGCRSIGAVLRELQPDFPDLTISKIRYLETEGLISPERRASGYRFFSDADVARLRFVLTAQRDRFWPLKVIKDALDRLDQGHEVPGLTVPLPAQPAAGVQEPVRESDWPQPTGGDARQLGAKVADLSAAALRRRRAVRLTPVELRERTGLDRAGYGQLKAFGLLRTDEAGKHRADDIDVAAAAAILARYGLEPRHLRSFRIGADREISLARQILEPLRRRRARGGSGPNPTDVEAELLSAMLGLHVALVRGGLGQQ